MHTLSKSRAVELSRELRRQAGRWLRELREQRGMSQSELAQKVGIEYYTFISQLEHGLGRVAPDAYLAWADALGVDRRGFVQRLMSYYDPVTYRIIFEHEPGKRPRAPSARRRGGHSVPRSRVTS